MLTAKSVRFGGSLQGGHGTASFFVPVADPLLPVPHAVRRGQWLVLSDGAHELWEGEVLSVRPAPGGFEVQGGGLLAVAAKRGDVSQTFVHRGAADWRIHPDANRSGEYTLGGEGALKLLIRKGAKEVFYPAMQAIYYLDEALSGDVITQVDYEAAYNVSDEGTYGFAFSILTGDAIYSVDNASSASDTGSLEPSVASRTNWVAVSLWGTDSAGTRTLESADKYIEFPTIDVFGSGLTAKPRLDEVMVAVATRTGLAVTSSSEAVGQVLDDIHFAATSAAAALSGTADLYGAPLDWGFWDDRSFRVRRIPRRPPKLHETVVVGGGMPGLIDWAVTPNDDISPDYVAVDFKNKDSAAYPEGFVRRIYVPHDPPDSADVVVERLDFSGLILSDAAAATAGAQLLGGSTAPYTLPSGAVWSIHPELADASLDPGNNVDPTDSYAQTVPGWPAGTVTGCAFTTASGWDGENLPLDPTCIVLDGSGDYVDFGDLAECDPGTGAFSVTAWVRLDVGGLNQPVVGKTDGTAGWLLWVSETDTVCAWVGQSGAYSKAAVSDSLIVGDWYHVALTWSGTTTQTLAVYLNGVAGTVSDQDIVGWTTGLTNSASLLVGS